MNIRQFEIWTANLNPSSGTEPGKIRPVVIMQTDLLNDIHPSTIVCPITTNLTDNTEILRVRLRKGQLEKVSEILVDQLRAIDNRRLIQKVGALTSMQIDKLKQNIRIVLDM